MCIPREIKCIVLYCKMDGGCKEQLIRWSRDMTSSVFFVDINGNSLGHTIYPPSFIGNSLGHTIYPPSLIGKQFGTHYVPYKSHWKQFGTYYNSPSVIAVAAMAFKLRRPV